MNQQQLRPDKSRMYRGCGVALITPFTLEKKIDFPALERMIEYVIQAGVDYIVSLGTTGESATLSAKEQRAVLDCTIRTVAKRIPIVAGIFGGNDTYQLCQKIKNFNFKDIDAILSSSPSYNKPTQKGIFQHYMQVAEVSPVPIIIYNVPGRTASNIEADTIVRLAKANPKFVAVKEASGDMMQACQIIKHAPKDFLVLSGDDPTALALMACGGDGVISVIANAYAKEWKKMTHAILNENLVLAQELNESLLDLHQWLYIEGNPAGIKAACAIKQLCKEEVRLPLTALSEENTKHLKNEMLNVQQAYKRELQFPAQ